MERRDFLLGAAAAIGTSSMPAFAAEAPVTLWGPPAAPSVALAEAVASAALQAMLPGAAFKAWRTPDDMRAGLSSGSMQAVIVPTNVAANLYNRGLGVQLLNVMTRGLLYVVATQEVDGPKALAGRKVAVPFRNDMPDFILRRILASAGVKPGADVTLEYAGTPPEAAQMLLGGRVDAALLAEPAATAAIMRGKLGLKGFVRAIDCQKEWAAIGGGASIPQAGLAVSRPFVEKIGRDGLQKLQDAVRAATDAVVAHPLRTSMASALELGVLSPLVGEAIPHSNLIAVPASSVRRELEAFFSVLAGEDLRIIGGKLPDDGFYAL